MYLVSRREESVRPTSGIYRSNTLRVASATKTTSNLDPTSKARSP